MGEDACSLSESQHFLLNGDGVSVGDTVWSTKQEAALCFIQGNLTDVPQFFLMLISASAACHLLPEMVTGAAVFFLAPCLFAAYQNKYDLIRIQIWPCLPSPPIHTAC